MATVYRKINSEFYYAFFRVPGPNGVWKQFHRSTKKRKKGEAKEAAWLMEKAALAEAGAGDEKSGAIYSSLRQAADLAAQGRLNPDRARLILSEILEIGSGEDLRDYTVRAWTEVHLAEKKATLKPRSYLRTETIIRIFLHHLGPKADGRLEALISRDVQRFRDKLKEEGRAAKTANSYTKEIKSLLKAAVKEGHLLRNPAESLKALPENDSTKRKPFTVDEVGRLIATAPSADWRGVILLSGYGGLRLGDAAKLQAGAVDLLDQMVRFEPEKSSRKRLIVELPMMSELVAFFEEHPLGDDPSAPVFPSLADMTIHGRNGLSTGFTEIMKAANVSRGKVRIAKGTAGRNQYERGFHSLRHTFNSLMANADVPQETRMKLTGQSSREVNDIYTHMDFKTFRKAIRSIDDVIIREKIGAANGREQ